MRLGANTAEKVEEKRPETQVVKIPRIDATPKPAVAPANKPGAPAVRPHSTSLQELRSTPARKKFAF